MFNNMFVDIGQRRTYNSHEVFYDYVKYLCTFIVCLYYIHVYLSCAIYVNNVVSCH